MGSKKFTLIELHLDGETQFGPRSIGEALPMLGSDVDVETDGETETETEREPAEDADTDDGSSGKPIGVLVGLVVLVGIAFAAKKFRGGDDEEEEFQARDEPDVIVN